MQTNIDYAEIFSSGNIGRTVGTLLMYVTVFTITLMLIVFNIYKGNYQGYSETLKTIETTEGWDINLMCNVVGCEYVVTPSRTYRNTNSILRATDEPVNNEEVYVGLNKDLNIVIKYQDVFFILNTEKNRNDGMNIFLLAIALFGGLVTTLYISKMVAEHKRFIIEKGKVKLELEGKLQRNITESLHHEMGTSIVTIKTSVMLLFKSLYPCETTLDGICDFKVDDENKQCPSCIRRSKQRQVDKIASTSYTRIMFSVNALSSLQNLVKGSKHIKYSNGTVAIHDIIDNIISTNNSFNSYGVGKNLKAHYIHSDLLLKYACGKPLQNGEMQLCIHAMVINSMEAGSTKITFSASISEESRDKLDIIIEDNGSGVRNKLGNVIKNTDIFNYGYSTKDTDGKSIKLKSLFDIISFKFGLKNEISTRGVGLSVNKAILNNSGGDIKLLATSAKGTKFKVTIPIKLRVV